MLKLIAQKHILMLNITNMLLSGWDMFGFIDAFLWCYSLICFLNLFSIRARWKWGGLLLVIFLLFLIIEVDLSYESFLFLFFS